MGPAPLTVVYIHEQVHEAGWLSTQTNSLLSVIRGADVLQMENKAVSCDYLVVFSYNVSTDVKLITCCYKNEWVLKLQPINHHADTNTSKLLTISKKEKPQYSERITSKKDSRQSKTINAEWTWHLLGRLMLAGSERRLCESLNEAFTFFKIRQAQFNLICLNPIFNADYT